jgi:Ca-activated chloride channel family protein
MYHFLILRRPEAMTKQPIRCITFAFLFSSMIAFSQENNPIKTLKVDVDLVTVGVSVTDSRGRLVKGLGPEYFQLWEDKVEQKIEYLASEDLPASIGIILDISGSMSPILSHARNAALAFLKSGNLDDEYFLVEFSDRPRITQDFTKDISKLQNRLITKSAKGATSLYDAVYLGVEKLKEGTNPKKALLLISDGQDNSSRYTFANVREFVKEQNVQIFTIGFQTGDYFTNSVFIDPSRMEDLSAMTGGRALFPESVEELEKACMFIAAELKSQYVIWYRSTNLIKDGRWRRLNLKMASSKGLPRGLNLRFRTGYYAAGSDLSPDGLSAMKRITD